MYVTREADYAVRSVLFLAGQGGRRKSAREISEAMAVTRSFLAKILQRLSKGNIVASTKGVGGDFKLTRPAVEVNLLEVITAVQGPSATNSCPLDKKLCSLSSTCAVHPVWVELRKEVEKKLEEQNFVDLAARQAAGRLLGGEGRPSEPAEKRMRRHRSSRAGRG